ncbi:MAG: ORF6C domain-containing protein [Chloroflexi bacterium]|nr:ORF6C domain-containing protein [Chloroflexota bacterium]MCI0579465.1 ORF6C domain-containing protein [Chloroflexota bacterium]MCI0644918.1 ORF6C domain-containing protein [Chloroflexota bacterium]MCI0729686.1 ORF6C domain-containing protein [Chloroflexota bacterium]
MSDKALVPIEQKEVEFYADTIVAVRLADGRVYVPVKPICDLLGVDWGGQYRRIQRDAVLSEAIQRIDVTSTRRGAQEMICLPLDFVSGFLFGLNPARVKPEMRDRILLYQRECYKVLAEAFQEGRLTTAGDLTFEELLEQSDSEAVEAYRMLQAMVKLARNQILIEARLDAYSGRLDDYENRLEQIETTLGDPRRHITAEQAANISQAVKAIAMVLSQKSGRNEYGGVYGELYRRFKIPVYRELPAKEYEKAMAWLRDWWQNLTGDPTIPF